MADTFVISGLREKRAAMAGRIVDLRREADKLQAELVHIDAVLRLYGLEPSEIPNKGRMPVRSAYFGRNEISKRCRDLMREKGTIQAVEVAAQAMRDTVDVSVINTGKEPARDFVYILSPLVGGVNDASDRWFNAEIDGFVAQCRARKPTTGHKFFSLPRA